MVAKVKKVAKKKATKTASGARRETTRQRPITNNREAKIKMLVNTGMGNGAIWAALEEEYPTIIENNKRRAEVSGDEDLKYDAVERGRVSRAINSVRGLERKADARLMGIVEATGGLGITAKTLDQMDMVNRHRFSWGMAKMDEIYGVTRFVHEKDHPKSKYRSETKQIKTRDGDGKVVFKAKQVKIWLSGEWRQGDPMIPMPDRVGEYFPTRNEDGSLKSDLDMTKQITEHGCPEAFISIWGGGPGGGKSKLAVKAMKSVIKTTGEAILYVNGEAEEEEFRAWVGHDTDPDLFHVINAKLLPIQTVLDEAERLKPRVIVIDSVQTLAEWNKGASGQQSVMLILGAMKVNPQYGRPHIILISQLNKANDLKGSRDLEHLADAVAFVTQIADRENVSEFRIPVKNRAAPTPNGTMFKRMTTDVELFSDYSGAMRVPYQLTVPQDSPLNDGIIDPQLSSEIEEEDEGDEAGTVDDNDTE